MAIDLNDLLNRMDSAGFTQKERNNDRIRCAVEAILQAATRDAKNVRPVAMDAAFDALTEWPSMTPREVFFAGWEAAASHAPSADAVDAQRYRWLRDVSVPPHNFYLSVPDEFKDVKYSKAEVDREIDKAIAASAPKGDGND